MSKLELMDRVVYHGHKGTVKEVFPTPNGTKCAILFDGASEPTYWWDVLDDEVQIISKHIPGPFEAMVPAAT